MIPNIGTPNFKKKSIDIDGQYMILGGVNNIQVSNNAGLTWTVKTLPTVAPYSELYYTNGDMSHDGKYQYVCSTIGFIYKSVDYGVTWSRATSLYGSGIAVSKTGEYIIVYRYAGNDISETYYGKVYSDYGNTFVRDIYISGYSTRIVFARNNNNIYRINRFDDGNGNAWGTFQKSTDLGATFTNVSSTIPNDNTYYSTVVYDCAVDINGTNIAICATGYANNKYSTYLRLLTSNNGGVSWTIKVDWIPNIIIPNMNNDGTIIYYISGSNSNIINKISTVNLNKTLSSWFQYVYPSFKCNGNGNIILVSPYNSYGNMRKAISYDALTTITETTATYGGVIAVNKYIP